MPSLEKYGALAIVLLAAACSDGSAPDSDSTKDPSDSLAEPTEGKSSPQPKATVTNPAVAQGTCTSAKPGVSEADALKAIQADYAQFDDYTKSQTLYVALNHLTDGKCETDLDLRRYGIGVVLNMTSRAKDIVPPTFIDENKHIARVDVGKLTWTPETLSYLLLMSKYQDYGVISDGSNGKPIVVKGDWLAQHLTRPPIYLYVIRAEMLEPLIEAQAGVQPILVGPDAIQSRTFGGVYQSGVTIYPRILERRESLYGVCWISHDFLYRPQAVEVMESGQLPPDQLRFGLQEYIAREYICSLPNGLHEYNLTGFVSQRRYDAGGCVAKNRTRTDQLVLNGQCFNCHTNGWIPFKDKVRGDNKDPSQYILDHYPLQDDLDALFAHDQALFEKATAKIPYYSADYTESPLNAMIAEYGQRSGDAMIEPEGGTFGAILPRGATLGPAWEQYFNPIASLAVDVGILLPVSIANQAIPEYVGNELEKKYAEHGISEDLSKGCFNKTNPPVVTPPPPPPPAPDAGTDISNVPGIL